MRSIVRAALLATAIGALLPDVAICQDDVEVIVEEFDDAPPPRHEFDRPRKSWRRSPIIWVPVAVGLAFAIPIGVYQIIQQMRQWQRNQERPKEPWEIAMEQAERNRPK